MAATNALVKRQLDPNADYEVTITLDDNGEENKQVRRFNVKTPFFYSVLSDYSSETKVSKQMSISEHTNTLVETPQYTITTTDTWALSGISITMGTPNGATKAKYDPNPKNSKDKPYNINSKVTVILTFSHSGNKKLPTLADITSIQNVGNPFINFLLSKDGWTVDQDKRTIKISKYWSEVDPNLIKNTSNPNLKYTWRKNSSGKYGFWDSEVWVGLHELDAAGTNFKKNKFWTALSSSFIQIISTETIKSTSSGGETIRQQALSSTIDTNVPAFIAANSMNDYKKARVVDYFYFFVNQSGTHEWWYFDNDLHSIKPAKISLGEVKSKIKGTKGNLYIQGNNISQTDGAPTDKDGFPPVKKVVDKVTNKKTQISKAQLQARSSSANANLFSGTSAKYDVTKPISTKFPIITFNIRFGIVRYTSTDGGETWSGKWMPPLTNSDKLREATKILSRPEVVGVT